MAGVRGKVEESLEQRSTLEMKGRKMLRRREKGGILDRKKGRVNYEKL